MGDNRGFSLVEMLVSLAIFSVILTGIYVAYVTQARHTTREFKIAGSEMELGIAKTLVERDVSMGGYGLADDYGGLGFTPRGVGASNANPDTLTIMGTALGIATKETRRWTYMDTSTPSFRVWGDVREDLDYDDHVIVMEPSTRKLIENPSSEWLFRYVSSGSNIETVVTFNALTTTTVGTLIYGVGTANTGERPFAAVTYSLGNTGVPSICATGSQNLLRGESWTGTPAAGTGEPLLACVLDFQVAFGLDADENGTIELWDNGGVQAAGYDVQSLKKRVKQVRMYALVQMANRDKSYTYPQATVRVGDSSLGTGRDLPLSAEQRRFRWKLVTFSITPRNMR